MEILIRYHADIARLQKIAQGDWIDLRAAEAVSLSAGEYRMISLGISMRLPDGYEAHVVPRSSTFRTWGVLQVNSMGVVDASYRGDDDVWHYPVYATRDTRIEVGDRICQFRIVEKMPPVNFVEVNFLEGPSRGGFGSTGRA